MPTDDQDDLEEEFWDHVAAFESEEPKALSVVLPEAGVALPPPDELDDSQLSGKLWEVINMLALLGTFLHNTDHLSDRELYVELWGEILREPMVLMPDNPAYACHIDMVGSGSEEHTFLYMKYYADERARRSWLKEWPDDVMPDHEDPPYDRDRRLPQAESRTDGPVM
ncbi:MAG: hypothetical protein QOF89_2419 [Acidobacteriota bacterium]|jgi:hypothetical protein|nr:hypothetical protein [Acidobacteriota bacterium]